jgi:hypothetical protein
MCVCMHSHFIENHLIRTLEDGPLISEVVLSELLIGEVTVRADARVSCTNSKKLKIVGCLFMGLFGLRRAQQGVDLDPYLQLKFKLCFCCDSGKKP